MDMNCSDFLWLIWVFVVVFSLTSKDNDGMDDYDRRWGIAGEGKTRGILGYIYNDDEFDLWSNLIDHNPLYSY